MTNDQRIRQMELVVKLMEEVIGDVLVESHGAGEPALDPWEIHKRIGLLPYPHGSELVEFVGKRMQAKGLARNFGDETSPRWGPGSNL